MSEVAKGPLPAGYLESAGSFFWNISTSCELPPRAKPEIVQWFMDAAHDYGRYEGILG